MKAPEVLLKMVLNFGFIFKGNDHKALSSINLGRQECYGKFQEWIVCLSLSAVSCVEL